MYLKKIFIIIIIIIISGCVYMYFDKQKHTISKQRAENKDLVYKYLTEKQKKGGHGIIKTDGNHSFKLNENNKLFFYTKGPSQYRSIDINIKGVLKNEIIQCYKIKADDSHTLNLNELSEKCKEAIYFIGEFNKIFFYFGLKQEPKNRSKNLLVLPATNFFIYNNNIFNVSPYLQAEDYIINLNDIPLKSAQEWALKTSQSIHNISTVIKDFDIVLDYEFQNFDLKDYNLLIFPLHQEYMSDEFIEKFQDFLKKNNKVVLSIGGANFMRDFKLKDDDKIIIHKDKYKDNEYYNLNTYTSGFFKNCSYLDDDKVQQEFWTKQLGEVTHPLISNNIEYFFPKIKCDMIDPPDQGLESKIIPLLSTQTFNKKSNSKLIHILSDGIGINFTKIEYLKSKIVSELNGILNN